jgi:hypothetical protein
MRRVAWGLAVVAAAWGADWAKAGMIRPFTYDVINAMPTRFGSWDHYYAGAITRNGDGTVNYKGGRGTLNNGVIGLNEHNTQLFLLSEKTGQPAITVFLDKPYEIRQIYLYSFFGDNQIPGNIRGVDVTINGVTEMFHPLGFGPKGPHGPVHEVFDLGESSLSQSPATQVTLSDFRTVGGASGIYFAISEIQLSQTRDIIGVRYPDAPSPTPEPGSITLLCLGTAALAVHVGRRQLWRHLRTS